MQQSNSAYFYCINVAIIIMQKNIYLSGVTLAELCRHARLSFLG